MFRLTKRQRLEHPASWMDIESIETVPYPHLPLRTRDAVASMDEDGNQSKVLTRAGSSSNTMTTPWIKTPVASLLTQEIFFDRFEKEIVQPFRFTLSSQLQLLHEDESVADVKHRRSILRQRVRCGINEVSRTLEQAVAVAVADGSGAVAAAVPIMIILTMSDRVNPTLMSHIPVLAHQIEAPVLLLPGTSAAADLGKLLGIKSVSALAIVSSTSSAGTSENADTRLHQAVNSFANFMRGKV